MKDKLLVVTVVILSCTFSFADTPGECGKGLRVPFAALLGTSCGIGDKTFSFDAHPVGDPSVLSLLYFTAESGANSAGFEISGFPAATSSPELSSDILFRSNFTAVPSPGMNISSYTATVNGIGQGGQETVMAESSAMLADLTTSTSSLDRYDLINGTPSHTQLNTSGVESSFNGYFQLHSEITGSGTTRFDSADFVLNEQSAPATLSEGSEITMIVVCVAGFVGSMKKKFC